MYYCSKIHVVLELLIFVKFSVAILLTFVFKVTLFLTYETVEFA